MNSYIILDEKWNKIFLILNDCVSYIVCETYTYACFLAISRITMINLSYFRVAMDIPSRKRNVAPSGQGGEDGDFVQLRVVREQVCTIFVEFNVQQGPVV